MFLKFAKKYCNFSDFKLIGKLDLNYPKLSCNELHLSGKK